VDKSAQVKCGPCKKVEPCLLLNPPQKESVFMSPLSDDKLCFATQRRRFKFDPIQIATFTDFAASCNLFCSVCLLLMTHLDSAPPPTALTV